MMGGPTGRDATPENEPFDRQHTDSSAMRIEVTGRRLDLTDAIREHAEKKSEKILKHFDGVLEIEIVLDQSAPTEFSAETIVHVVKHDPFVGRANGEDVYAAIDRSVDKAARQVQEHKERLRDH